MSAAVATLSLPRPPETPRPVPAGTNGFKDWALICAALGCGRQSIILRKGGLTEGRDGFRFKHADFFLFPTQYHEQAAKVRPAELPVLYPAPPAPAGLVEIRYLFRLEYAHWLADWTEIARLEPFHVWGEPVVRERFEYDATPGLQCAFGRVYRLEPVWTFADRPAYGGCRSWVILPACPPETTLTPVLDDDRHAAVRAALQLG